MLNIILSINYLWCCIKYIVIFIDSQGRLTSAKRPIVKIIYTSLPQHGENMMEPRLVGYWVEIFLPNILHDFYGYFYSDSVFY
jgi:hypothetical protein